MRRKRQPAQPGRRDPASGQASTRCGRFSGRVSAPSGPGGYAAVAGLAGALAGAVGGDVLAVAAVAGVAVAAGPVAGQVDQNGVAVGGVADAQAFGLAQADQVGEGEAGLGPDAVGQRGGVLGDVQVPAPAAAVVDDPGAGVGVPQQRVDQSGLVGRGGGLPDRTDPGAQRDDRGQIVRPDRAPGDLPLVQEGFQGGDVGQLLAVVALGVDQVGGHGQRGGGVVGEQHGTPSDLGGQAFGGDQAVAVPQQLGQLIPIVVIVQPDPDPALGPDVGGHVEPLRVVADQGLLDAGPGLERHRGLVLADHDEQLVADPEGRRGVAAERLLSGFGQGEADLADPRDAVTHVSKPSRTPADGGGP